MTGMHRRVAFVLVLLVALLVSGCSNGAPSVPDAPPRDAAQVVADLASRVGPADPSVVYTAENDPNRLLGRPGQYTSAAAFADSRVPEEERGEPGSVESGGRVEVFATEAQARARMDYIGGLAASLPFAVEYDYVSGSVLVRVSRILTPQQAEEYRVAVG